MATARERRWVAAEFDRRAATYDESVMHHWQAQRAVDLVNPATGTVLDVATGTGLAAAALARAAPVRIVGIDISERMLSVARGRRLVDCRFLRADASELPFSASVFDAVMCVSSVSYFTDLDAVLREWHRVARPNAVLVFTTPAEDGLPVNRLLREAAATAGVCVPDPHRDLGSAERIASRVQPLGLSVEVVERAGFPAPLGGDPRTAFDQVLDYGFAESVRTAPPTVRAEVFARYADAHHEYVRNGQGSQDFLFIRLRRSETAARAADR